MGMAQSATPATHEDNLHAKKKGRISATPNFEFLILNSKLRNSISLSLTPSR